MTALSLNIKDNQVRTLLEYAEAKNMTLEELIESIVEEIEDKLDSELADEGYERYLKNPDEAVPHKEVMKRFGLK